MTSKREETRERDTLLAEKDMADGAVAADATHADPAPDEESEVPTDAAATARRLWEAAWPRTSRPSPSAVVQGAHVVDLDLLALIAHASLQTVGSIG